MKAITLHEPYATLIAHGDKTIETRHWPAPAGLVGQDIAIHAAKRVTPTLSMHVDTEKAMRRTGINPGHVVAIARLARVDRVKGYYLGCDCGFCGLRLLRTLPDSRVKGESGHIYRTDPHGDFTPGRYLWVLQNIRRLKNPVAAVGHQGFFNWTPPRGCSRREPTDSTAPDRVRLAKWGNFTPPDSRDKFP